MPGQNGTQSRLPLLLTASAGCALSLIDTSVMAIAVPAITREFGGDAVAGQWVISAFFLCFAGSLLPAGVIADRLGRRRTLLAGLMGLALASLLGGLTSAPFWLHIFRGLQGCMMAFVLTPALAIIGHRFHQPEERSRAWAIWGGIMGVTMVVAPVAGGLIVETLSWRWAFFITVPICGALAPAIVIFAQESSDSQRGGLDPLGIILFASAVFSFTWALINGQVEGRSSPTVLGGFAIGGALMVAFILAEKFQKSPTLNLALFKEPSFVGAVWAMFSYAATAQVMASLLPIFFQNGLRFSAMAAGMAVLPFGVAMLIFPYVGVRLSRSLTSAAMLTLGLVVVAVGHVSAASAAFSGNWTVFTLGFFVIGSGAGLLNGETQKAILANIPRDQTGLASGISTTARFSGILIGFAVLSAVQASAHIAATSERSLEGIAEMSGTYTSGFACSLLVAAGIAGISAVLVWALMCQPEGNSS